MGLFNFVKEAGENCGTQSPAMPPPKIKAPNSRSISIRAACGTDKVDVQVVDGKAVVTGDAVSQS